MAKWLKDVSKIVDLKLSELELPSDPKKAKEVEKMMRETGRFKFIKKVYINFYEKAARPPWWFTWCRYDARNNFRDLYEWEVTWNYTAVNLSEDPYWPDGLKPNENGNYVYGDLILVKRPLIEHLEDQLEHQARTQRGAREKLEQFHEHKKGSRGGSIPEDMFQELLGDLPK